jgi:hypothetical protein
MLASILLPFLAASTFTAATLHVTGQGYINYTTITGYFLQDDPSTNASTFNYVRSSPSSSRDPR